MIERARAEASLKARKQTAEGEKAAARILSEAEVQAEVDAKHLRLIIQPCDLPDVQADQDKTHQVLLNLIGNAIKFTDSGGTITISFNIKGNSKSNNSTFVETSVSDTGQGIPKEDLPKLFTKFGRLEGSLTAMAKHKGTGLGLYITKQYIEMMDGKITVQSPARHDTPASNASHSDAGWPGVSGGEVDKGTTFTFTLPIASKT